MMLLRIIILLIKGKIVFLDILLSTAIYGVAIFISVKLLFLAFDFFLKKFEPKIFYFIIFLPLICFTSFLFVILLNLFYSLADLQIYNKLFAYIWYYIFGNLVDILAFSAIYFIVEQWSKTQVEKENTLRANELASEAQTLMLRYQINPHFLFNTLNTIRAVILEDKEKARSMITELSDFFRYTLSKNINDSVELHNEIDAVKNYLQIQEIRFEENLVVEINIDPAAEKIKIPIFIIHPLVENAVKYGIQTSSGALKINIESQIKENILFISVLNSGKLVEQENLDSCRESTNTGISNIQKRLKLFYADRAAFSLSENNGFVKAEIQISLPDTSL